MNHPHHFSDHAYPHPDPDAQGHGHGHGHVHPHPHPHPHPHASEPDADQQVRGVLALRWADAHGFFNAVVNNHACPFCSTTRWQLAGDDEHHFTVTSFPKLDHALAYPEFLPVLCAVCDGCGYLRMHSSWAVARWKARMVTAATGEAPTGPTASAAMANIATTLTAASADADAKAPGPR